MKSAVKSTSRAKKSGAAPASRALAVAKRAAPKMATAGKGRIGEAKSKAARVLARNPFRTALGALALGFVFAKLKTIF